MSVSKREVANSSVDSIDHRGSNWKEMPGREEIAVTLWQQAHTQSLSDEDDSFPEPVACDASEGWPQQSWDAHAPAPESITPATTMRQTNLVFADIRRVMVDRF